MKDKDSGQYKLNSAMAATLFNVIFEIDNALRDLTVLDPYVMHLNQRRTLFSVRYAMEGMADLTYLEKHPENEDKFITSADLGDRIEMLKDVHDPIERDRALAEILRNESRISGSTLSRVDAAFPRGGLAQYAALCLFTHNNDLGNRLAARSKIRDYLELYHQSISALRSIIAKLAEYMADKAEFSVSKEDFSGLVRKLDAFLKKLYSVLYQGNKK